MTLLVRGLEVDDPGWNRQLSHKEAQKAQEWNNLRKNHRSPKGVLALVRIRLPLRILCVFAAIRLPDLG